jgi:GT2 family glycosyltransferase
VDVSVVIVSYNGRDYLRRCLASIYEHTQGIEFEVIVVDNASQDGTPEMVAAEFPQATLIRRTSNAGFARAVNEGVAVARGDTLFVLNPDTLLEANVLPPMLAYLGGHPETGILAPRILDEDGGLQLSCRRFPGFTTAAFNRYSLLTRLLPGNPLSRRYLMTDFDHQSIADVDWASAACWLLPRAVYDRIGPLDDRYFWSIEDVDYCQRVHRAGLRVVYFPEVSVRHRIGGSAASAPSRTIIARHRGMWRYYRSYLRPQTPVVQLALDTLVGGGIALRAGAQIAAQGVRRALGRRPR